ncbi:unnamed protein product [Anisakis simplex]|uniref:Protein kinase domain-containing protein n=1 Tax=Anisakis simplex TaxID=6269 RepID=A0A0M3KCZ2_ANISI|nr:unnamed protein product [Anisakis simplex]
MIRLRDATQYLQTSISVAFNTTTASTPTVPNIIMSSIFIAGLLLLFAFLTCVVCGILIARRKNQTTKNYRKKRSNMLVTSVGQKGISTDLYSAHGNDFQFQKGALFLDNDKKWQPTTWGGNNLKSPSWSNFHFPPPPSEFGRETLFSMFTEKTNLKRHSAPVGGHRSNSNWYSAYYGNMRRFLYFAEMYGVDESSAEPLLGRMTTPTLVPTAPSPRRNHVDRTWPKKRLLDDNLHYATSNVTESAKSYKPIPVEKIDSRSVLLGAELGEGRFTIVRIAKLRDKTVATKMIKETTPQAKLVS